jgi:hypothetical protein
VTGREVLAVAEDGAQRFWNWAKRRVSTRKATHWEAFQPAVQPLRPRRVGVTVGEKCAVLEIHVPGPRLKRPGNVNSMQNRGNPFKERLEHSRKLELNPSSQLQPASPR